MSNQTSQDRNHSILPARRDRLAAFLLFFLLLGSFTYFLPRWADWSQNSRLNLTLAIVDYRSLSIDPYFGNTGDYAQFNGHYYSDKAPGPSFLGVPVYAAVRPILQSGPVHRLLDRLSSSPAMKDTLNQKGTGLLKDKIYYMAVLIFATFVASVIPSALVGVLIFLFLRKLGLGRGWAASVVLIYAFATNAFPYSGAFYSHQLTAFLLFGAFWIGFLLRRSEISPAWSIAAGFLLGFSLISEYPTILIALAIFIYIIFSLWRSPNKKWILGFVAAGVPPGILLLAYNRAIYGNPFHIGYENSALYTEQHSQGLISLTYPHLEALWGISFGSLRGLFYVAPVLLLAVIGLVLWLRWGRYRAEWLVCTWAVISFFLFNGSSIMWQGGFSIGPRYLVPMLPFLVMGLGIFGLLWGKSVWARLATALLAVWSFAVVWAETIGGQSYPDWTTVPLLNYSFPRLAAGDIARNWGMFMGLHGWISLLPLAVFMLVMAWLLVRAVRAPAA